MTNKYSKYGWFFWSKYAERIARKDEFFPIVRESDKFPLITGMPKINIEKYRPFIRKSKYNSKMLQVGLKKGPKDCFLYNIINYPYKRLGAPQIAIKGNMGTYKSNILNLFLAMFAAKGVKPICFCDDAFEYRHFAAHQYLHPDTKKMTPFQVDVWIPEGYTFKTKSNTNPLWNYRSNVQARYYTSIDDILDSLEPHRITTIYDACFDKVSKLKLLIDIYMYCAENVSYDNIYMLVHHELQSLLSESPSDARYELSNIIAEKFGRSRKDRVGILCTYHMSSEVFYKIGNKMRFLVDKMPANKTYLTKTEKDVRKLRRNQCNISEAGYWATHTIGYFPELPDEFRLVPQRKKIEYPSLKTAKKKDTTKVEVSNTDFLILKLKAQGKSWKDMERIIGMNRGTIYGRAEKMGVL